MVTREERREDGGERKREREKGREGQEGKEGGGGESVFQLLPKPAGTYRLRNMATTANKQLSTHSNTGR